MYDVIILGSGPAGISMAIECLKSGIKNDKILIIEKTDRHSFSIRRFYPDTKSVTANYKGSNIGCKGNLCIIDTDKDNLIKYLDNLIIENNLTINYNETVYKINKNNDMFTILTDNSQYLSKIVVIAIGIFNKPNKPDYKLPQSLNSRILFDLTGEIPSNSDVVVVGGGDSAAEYSLYLIQQNNRVTLSYRKDEITKMNDINKKMIFDLSNNGSLNLKLGYDIESIDDKNSKISVNFKNNVFVDYDYIIYALGGTTPNNFLNKIGVEFNGQYDLKDGFETNIPGLFLIGDISAGQKGGSIISAFNSSNEAIQKICSNYLECSVKTHF